MSNATRAPSAVPRLGAALALSLLVASLLAVLLLRPASHAPIPPVWEPRPPVMDQIPGSPGPPAR